MRRTRGGETGGETVGRGRRSLATANEREGSQIAARASAPVHVEAGGTSVRRLTAAASRAAMQRQAQS